MRPGLADSPVPVQTFLAFDFGVRRVGVATGNTLTKTATPLATIALAADARFDAIAALLREWRPAALVVGVPFHPDGAAHANTARARRFGRELATRFALPVHEVDERYSTVEAAREVGAVGTGRARERKGDGLDARSAAVILEQFFASEDRS